MYYKDYFGTKTNVKVETESTQIRHLAIECPNCNNWFKSYDICKTKVHFVEEIINTNCECPMCNYNFKIGNNSNIEEDPINFTEFYTTECMTKEVTFKKGE